MTIRRLTQNDFMESLQLSMYAFQYSVPDEQIPARQEQFSKHQVLGVWEEEVLAAKLHILPFETYVQGKQVSMGGVAGVATYPEFRRKGYVKKLMIESLREMKENEQILSFLHPFDIAFYRKYGWEVLSDNKKVTIDQRDLKMVGAITGHIKRFDKTTHHNDIEQVYDQFAREYTGALVRDRDWWLNSVYHNSQLALFYNDEGIAKGYLLYKVNNNKMDVHEWVSLDFEAKRNLWNFICQHDSMVKQVHIITSTHDDFTYFLQQPKVKVEIEPYFMARIVDVEPFLNQYEFEALEGQVFLHVTDEHAPWNNGSYLISKDGIKAFKEKNGSRCAEPAKVGIHLSINVLTAILLGYMRPSGLYSIGQVQGREEDIVQLEKFVPQQRSFFYDFF